MTTDKKANNKKANSVTAMASAQFKFGDYQSDWKQVAATETKRADNTTKAREANKDLADMAITSYAGLVAMVSQLGEKALTKRGNFTPQFKKAFVDALANYGGVKAQARLDRYTKNTAALVRNRDNIGVNKEGDTVSIPSQATASQIKLCLLAAGLDSENKIASTFLGDGGISDIDKACRSFVGSPTYSKVGAKKTVNGFRLAKKYQDNPDIVRELIEALEAWERVAIASQDGATEEAKKEAAVKAILDMAA